MSDIVERLQAAMGEGAQSDGTLLMDAVEEIVRLRGEYKRLMSKVEQYEKLAEPEF